MATPELAIARRQEYGGIGGDGVTLGGKLIAVKDYDELTITSHTKLVDNPPVSGALSAPRKVYFDPSMICPADCSFCLSAVHSRRRNGDPIPFLPLDDLEKINCQLIAAGVLAVKFGGGEPGVYEGFFRSVEQLGPEGLAISVSTSGVTLTNEKLLPDKKIDLLAKYGVKISISVDGAPEFHNSIRKIEGLSQMALGPGMQRLLDGGIPKEKLQIRSTIINTPESIDQLAYLDELSKKLGLILRIRFARPYGSAKDNDVCIVAPTPDVVALSRELRNRAKENRLLNIDKFLQFDRPTKTNTILECSAATRTAGIDARGNLIPCGAIAAHFPDSHSLLNGESLLNIWQNGKAFLKVREYFKQRQETSPCRNCKYVHACQSGCPSVELSVGATKNPLCPRELNL